MPRNIDSDLLPYLYSKNTTPLSGYVFSITGLDSHKYVMNTSDISDYTALGVKRSPIRSEEGTILNELEVSLDNTDLNFRSMVMSGQFDNVYCKIRTLFIRLPNTIAGYIDLYNGYLDAPKGDDHFVSFTIRPYPLLEREIPKRIYQTGCNWSFCDNSCGLDLGTYQVTTTLTADSDGETLACTHGRAVDYFNPGYIQITSGDYNGEYRPILTNDTSSVTCRVSFGHTIPSGTSVLIQQLCPKIPDACENTYSNYSEYGGFPFIPTKPIL